MEILVLLVLGVLGVILAGSVAGLSAAASLRTLRRRVDLLEMQISSMRRQGPPPVPVERPAASPPAMEAPRVESGVPRERAESPEPARVVAPARLAESLAPASTPPAGKRLWEAIGGGDSPIEVFLGTRGILWGGGITLLVGLALFLQYCYDNNWIGPQGRLAIGTLAGVGALAVGERFRRRGWPILFQAFTGGGIAAFYICIYFAFDIYHLSGQGTAFALASLVTAFAVVMSVAHNAMPIAVLGLLGGFLSPVLLSTGENRPYVLFGYVLLLDLAALGAATFRKWRAVDLLCLAGTALLYAGWHNRFYGIESQPSQMPPALLFVTLFYLVFLVLPLLNGMVRRVSQSSEDLVLVAAASVLSFLAYYRILFHEHRHALGFVVIGQAVLVLLLFRLYRLRVGEDNRTSSVLLVISLALVTIAMPIQLRFYALAMAWAIQGGVMTYVGIRFRQLLCRIAGLIALFLATGALIERLPLHRLPFLPVFNAPFGSWAFVAAVSGLCAWLSCRKRCFEDPAEYAPPIIAGALGYLLGVAALSFETWLYWALGEGAQAKQYAYAALITLWALIPTATLAVLLERMDRAWSKIGLAPYAVALLFLVAGHHYYRPYPSTLVFANLMFAGAAALVVALWAGSELYRRAEQKEPADILLAAGHVLLAILLAFEMTRWSRHSELLTRQMGLSLISALWAAQACALVALGLVRRSRLRRIMGFVLFALVLGKVWLIDTSAIDRVYRIVSFIAAGLLALPVSYLYHRLSAMLPPSPKPGDTP